MLHKVIDPTLIKFRAFQAKKSKFIPKVTFEIPSGRYLVKTASNDRELREALELRYQVFLKEGLNKRTPYRVDVDRFDFLADHLLIIDQEESRIVGTYRLISSLFSDHFYSQTEFHLDGILDLPGVKLELGRACTASDMRSGIAIALLWRGIANYIQAIKADYLFGCASVKVTDPSTIHQLSSILRAEGHLIDDYDVTALPSYKVPAANSTSTPIDDCQELIPSLLRSYFKAGAKVCGEPALDKDFHCIDYLTLLNTRSMNESFERRYKLC